MNMCYNCGGAIPERLENGRRRHYCNDTCRKDYKRKTAKDSTDTPKTPQDAPGCENNEQ